MNCKQSQELIRTLPRTEWGAQDRLGVDEHVGTCTDCASMLLAEEKLDAELQSLFEPEPPDTIVPLVMARIRSQPSHHGPASSRTRIMVSTSSRWLGLTVAIGAYLFAFVQGESSTLSLMRVDRVLQGFLAPSMTNVSTVVFAVGLLLYLAGLFEQWSRSPRNANAQ